jgi:hypothetical protein
VAINTIHGFRTKGIAAREDPEHQLAVFGTERRDTVGRVHMRNTMLGKAVVTIAVVAIG